MFRKKSFTCPSLQTLLFNMDAHAINKKQSNSKIYIFKHVLEQKSSNSIKLILSSRNKKNLLAWKKHFPSLTTCFDVWGIPGSGEDTKPIK